MQRFVVTQDYDEIWWVRDEGAFNLYCYPSEEEARTVALALAKNATENGAAATVLINPSIRIRTSKWRTQGSRRAGLPACNFVA